MGQIEGERKALRLRIDLENEAVHGLDTTTLLEVLTTIC